MTTIPEIKGLTKEVMERLVEIGDIEWIKGSFFTKEMFAIKSKEGIDIAYTFDAAIIMSKLNKLDAVQNNEVKKDE